jgi:hypothetical protein
LRSLLTFVPGAKQQLLMMMQQQKFFFLSNWQVNWFVQRQRSIGFVH